MNITLHIPPGCERYADDIKRFADAMLWKLRKNAHKGRWEDLPIGEAYQLLCGECEELRAEIERPSNAFDIIFEAADVANYALMIASMAVEKVAVDVESVRPLPEVGEDQVVQYLLTRNMLAEAERVLEVNKVRDDDIPF